MVRSGRRRGVADQQVRGQDRGGDPAADPGGEPDPDVVAGRQVGRHVVAQVPGGRHGEASSFARRRLAASRDSAAMPTPASITADMGPVGLVAVADVDDLVVGRGHQRALHQLGDQVGEVGGGGADHRHLLDAAHRHPLVVLHLAQRRSHHVGERDRPGPLPRRLDPRQHQQRLRAAPHAGGQVVEAEEVGEHVGVGLDPFERR